MYQNNTDFQDTIFALSTTIGKSAVAVIRITGKASFKAIEYFNIKRIILNRVATFVKLIDSKNQLIDKCLLIKFEAPNSFTGENMVELQVHGGRAVISNVLNCLGQIFRPAKPGEFSLRAFLNGKINLLEAESIADLIDAETHNQANQALNQMSGKTMKLYQDWRENIIEIQSNVEAYIDFPDEITEYVISDLEQNIRNLIECLSDHLNDSYKGERLREGLKVAILGEPNSGKSTLMNCLAQRDVAIVSEYAGTTRDSIELHLDIGGYPVILIDTAGIRESSDVVESEGIKRSLDRAKSADLKIILFPSDKLDLDQKILNLVDENTICVLSKADDFKEKEFKISNLNFLVISVHKSFGVDDLIFKIENFAKSYMSSGNDPVITRARQRNHIQNTVCHLKSIDFRHPYLEIAAEELRLAACSLGEVAGIITSDDVLNKIFGKFCLGK